MPVYTLYIPVDNTPLFFNSASPRRYGSCLFCKQSKKIRNSHHIVGPKLENIDYEKYVTYRFCDDCFYKYRVLRPCPEELSLRKHKIILRKVNKQLNLYLPKSLNLFICNLIKYP